MNWWEYFKEALKGLGGHKVRAFLSALGILFGVGSVVAVVSVATTVVVVVSSLSSPQAATRRPKATSSITSALQMKTRRDRSTGIAESTSHF